MVKKIKYGKMAIVILITALIWVWADLALDEKLPVSGATITVAKSTDPSLLVSFADESSVFAIEEIVLKGPLRRIAEISRRLEEGERLDFPLDAVKEEMGKAGSHTLKLAPFLQKDRQIKDLNLKVESCKPETLSVNVVKLVPKQLDVRCVDENKNPVKTKTIEPDNVKMFVPEGWQGEKLIAEVLLTQSEIDQARVSAISETPYIRLPGGQIRKAATTVQITTPPQEDPRSNDTITAVTVGIILSANLQGKYAVEVENLDEVIRTISIRATPDAKRAYENMRYQVILEIDDEDARSTEPLKRELVYNFPPEHDRKGEIILDQEPVQAKFKLIRLPSAGPP